MATSEGLDSAENTFDMHGLLTYVNKKNHTNFNSLTNAVASLGASAVGAAAKAEIALTLAGLLGVALALASIVDAIEAGIDSVKLGKVLAETTNDDKIKVTTEFYAWLSGSGNHTGYYAETTYEVVK